MQPQPVFSSDPAPAEGAPFALGKLALAARAEWLNRRWADASTERILADAIELAFKGRIALVSSFGADAAVLLHLVAQVDKATPVLFLETGKHFLETLTYRDILIDRFGFTDARSLEPAPPTSRARIPPAICGRRSPDRCCHLRKVLPLDAALKDFDAWITGRKRFQTKQRAALPIAEVSDGKIKINPLAAGARRRSTRRSRISSCRGIRCSTRASPRSAARPARGASWKAKTAAPAAGPAARRPSAAFISGLPTEKAYERPRRARKPEHLHPARGL